MAVSLIGIMGLFPPNLAHSLLEEKRKVLKIQKVNETYKPQEAPKTHKIDKASPQDYTSSNNC